MNSTWIWLPLDRYPEHQTCKFDVYDFSEVDTYAVAEFQRLYEFESEIASVTVYFSADNQVQLYCNGEILATGPASIGGDFLENGKARPWYYESALTFVPKGNSLCFFARVKLSPTQFCDFSKGHGGFMLRAQVVFDDGSTADLTTDKTWSARKNGAYICAMHYDGRIAPDPYYPAEEIPDIWQTELAPIPVREEKKITLGTRTLAPREECTCVFDLDRIYAGFMSVSSVGDGAALVSLGVRELEEDAAAEVEAVLVGCDEYRSFCLASVGCVSAVLKNESDVPMIVCVDLIATCYPVTTEALTVTSDAAVNKVLDVCRHTLKYCRQTHHLDSPRHCEPLACTGDYYIEALMTATSFGDMRLAEFDILRTAELLRHNDGRMFHTSYSLIWVRMLYDIYRFGGDETLLWRCRDALDLLLGRFATYLGENGLIEFPPDYMFVDWIYEDGISLHHPPKALGQTVLNMFYYMALRDAERIYAILGDEKTAAACRVCGDRLQNAVNTLLYDAERGMYFEGLNTLIPEDLVSDCQPQNVSKRYYLKHSNIMAAYTSICSEDISCALIEKIMRDEIKGVVQPYFMHYLLEAIAAHGMRESYTMPLIDHWKDAVAQCSKGLAEGFYPPEPTYRFDHSHAWGGTPLYSLPKALLGLEILAPGYQKIRLSPSLLGLEAARVEIPTPHGMIVCDLKQGQKPSIIIPDGIIAEIDDI